MRIRRCASRLLGSSASTPALPLFELPPPSPPPAHEPHAAGPVAAPATSSSPVEPCVLSLSPWDLMDQLHLSDPQEEKIFLETYLVAVAWRASWLFQPSMPAAGSIKEEDMATVDMVDGAIFELCVASRKRTRKKYGSKPKKGEAKEEAEGSDAAGGGGGARVWTCKKKDGKGWFCRRPVSQPDSLCRYHSDQKLLGSAKPRKSAAAYAGEGFYYYAGFGPSRSKRHRVSSSTGGGVPEPSPAGQKEEAPPDDPEEHIGLATGQDKADGAEHEATPLAHVDNRPSWENGMAGIAGCDEESSDDLYVVESRDIKRKSPSLKKRWRKPVKARSLKSLM